MDDYDLTAEEYEALYEKYLVRSPDDLLLVNGPIEGKRVLDLCCGGMRASLRAKELGAEVISLDRSYKIIPDKYKNDVICCDVDELCLLKSWRNKNLFVNKVDLVICQQGVNYWFDDECVKNVSMLINNGGCFVFNTFHNKPSNLPTVKQYTFNGHNFTEIVQLVDNTIYHLQMREGYTPHYTRFKWLPKETIENVLSKHFNRFDASSDQTTSIYTCWI